MNRPKTDRITALLIEDNPRDARLLEDLLQESEIDIELRREASLEEGLEVARKDPPDVLVLDPGLPDSGGRETVERAAEAVPDMPLVVLTAQRDTELALEALEAGADNYLRKDELSPSLAGRTLRWCVERRRLEEEARSQRELSRSILRSLPEHVAVLGADGTVLATNETWQRWTDEQGGALWGNEGQDFLQLAERAAADSGADEDLSDGIRSVLAGESPAFSTVYRSEGGGEGDRWFRVAARPLAGGQREEVVVSLYDITRRKRTEQELQQREERFRQMAAAIEEVFWLRDPEADEMLYVSPAFEDVWGRSVEQLYHDPTGWVGTLHPEDRERVVETVFEDGDPSFDLQYRIVRPNGETRWIQDRAFPVTNGDGEVKRVAGVARDITEEKRLQEELRHRALHDPLTELPNRSLLEDRVEQGIARARRRGQPLGLLVLDVDNFKRINDRLGHTAGDQVLTELARRLQAAIREEDTVARWGGDEFVVVLPELEEPEALHSVRRRIREATDEVVEAAGEPLQVHVSIGAVVYSESEQGGTVQTEDPDELFRYGDLALHRAKERSPGGFHVFTGDEEAERAAPIRREQELRRALEEDQFVPYFQPIARLSDGAPVGVEVLARWRHPDRGVLPPAEFLALAEELGLMAEVGDAVARRAVREAADWTSPVDGRSLYVSVNMSAQQFQDAAVVDRVESWLDEAGLQPERLVIELTETSLIQATSRVEALQAMGIRVHVDDFGTGHGTFVYLRQLEVNGLKIDRSLVQGLTENPTDAALVETLLTLGEKMDLTVVAEGVETEAQRDRLRELGQRMCQGFLFARPKPGAEVQDDLRRFAAS